MALVAATFAAAAPSASDQHLLERYRDELVDISLNGVYDCDPPGTERIYEEAITRMRRIKPLLIQRVGTEAFAAAHADAERAVQETTESVGIATCRIGDEAFDRQNLARIRGRHEIRLEALEAGLGLKSEKNRR